MCMIKTLIFRVNFIFDWLLAERKPGFAKRFLMWKAAE